MSNSIIRIDKNLKFSRNPQKKSVNKMKFWLKSIRNENMVWMGHGIINTKEIMIFLVEII